MFMSRTSRGGDRRLNCSPKMKRDGLRRSFTKHACRCVSVPASGDDVAAMRHSTVTHQPNNISCVGRAKLEGDVPWYPRTETTFAPPRPTKNFSSLTFRMTY